MSQTLDHITCIPTQNTNMNVCLNLIIPLVQREAKEKCAASQLFTTYFWNTGIVPSFKQCITNSTIQISNKVTTEVPYNNLYNILSHIPSHDRIECRNYINFRENNLRFSIKVMTTFSCFWQISHVNIYGIYISINGVVIEGQD